MSNYLTSTVYENALDSLNPTHSKKGNRTIYIVSIDNKHFITGYTWQNQHDYKNLISKKHIRIQDYENQSGKYIPFNEITLICQRDLVQQMCDLFPWNESYWGSREAFEEYYYPKTFEGKLAKSLRDNRYFKNEIYEKDDWKTNILEEWDIEKNKNSYGENGTKIVKFKTEFYYIRYGISSKQESWVTLEHLSQEKALKELQLLNQNNSEQKISKKDHAQKCGLLARKYKISFIVSLRCSKGNEEEIKNFVTTLSQALGKKFNSNELCCGRARRRAEIERLGIDIGSADPNYIADYILECLTHGKIIT